MSSGFWQINKQREQFKHGKSTTAKVRDYVAIWESRCYSSGIPDEVPESLSKTLRAPSYKAIAVAILKNDLNLVGAGFQCGNSETVEALLEIKKSASKKQGELF